jgi:hypothetical protein
MCTRHRIADSGTARPSLSHSPHGLARLVNGRGAETRPERRRRRRRLGQPTTPQLLVTLSKPICKQGGTLVTASLSPDDRFIIAAGWPDQLLLWSIEEHPNAIRRFGDAGDSINWATLSPDGRFVCRRPLLRHTKSAGRKRLAFFDCRLKPRLQSHTDQCCDQDRGVQLPDQCFCRGQRSRNAVDRIRIAIGYGRESFKAEIDQTGGFACCNSGSQRRLKVDGARNHFQEQFVTYP